MAAINQVLATIFHTKTLMGSLTIISCLTKNWNPEQIAVENITAEEITDRETASWEGSLRARRSTQVRLETALSSEFFLFTFHHPFLLRFHSSVTGQGSIQLGVNFPGTFPTGDYIFLHPSTAESLLSAVFKWGLFNL